MRELRFVTPGDAPDYVVVEAVQIEEDGIDHLEGEQFLLSIDDSLRTAINPRRPLPYQVDQQGDHQRDEATQTRPGREEPVGGAERSMEREIDPSEASGRDGAPSSTGNQLSPREIQMRVRAGEDPQHLAEVLHADINWVMRFAGPVMDERLRMADEPRRARARRSTADGQTVVFGEAVDSRFSAHGIEVNDVRWDSHRREDGQWVIRAHWVGGEIERTAEWLFNLSGRSVSPLDDTASDLLSDRPIHPIADLAPVRLTIAPQLDDSVVAFPAQPNALTGPLPTRQQLFDQAKFDKSGDPPASRPVTAVPPQAPPPPPPAPAQISAVADDDQPHLFSDPMAEPSGEPMAIDEPDPDPIPEPIHRVPLLTNLGIAHREHETEEEKAARAHIPSWDDILLGVRRKND
jgi:hypothetical protein